MLVEVALRVGELGGLTPDGATLAWYPAKGRFLTPNEMLQWIDNATEPDLSAIRPNLRQAFRKKVEWSRYFLDPALNPETAARVRWDARRDTVNRRWRTLPQSTRDGQIAMIQEIIADRQQWRLDKIQDGAHERWGQHILRHSGIAIMDISALMAIDIVKLPEDDAVPPEEFGKPKKKRRFVVDYKTLLSAESVADWQDTSKQVLPASLDPGWRDADAWTETNLDMLSL